MDNTLVGALKLGVIGLSGIALVYSAAVIYKEQSREGLPRQAILRHSAIFMGFCLILVTINSYVQLQEHGIPNDPKTVAAQYIQDDKQLQKLAPEQIARSLNPAAGGDVWGMFYRYRATIRSLLRHKCLNNSIPIKVDESMSHMVDELEKTHALDSALAADIKKIDHATFTAQWGAGDEPDASEAEFVAMNAKRIIQDLQKSL